MSSRATYLNALNELINRHQLARPRLWLSKMGLMIVVVAVVISTGRQANQQTHQLVRPRLRLTMMGLMMTPPPQYSKQAHQQTHQLAQPRLCLSLMRLVLMVMLVTSRSKCRQKVEESSKSPKSPKDLKNLQRSLVWRNIYQSTNPPSIRCGL